MGADDIVGRAGDDTLHGVLGTEEVRGEDGHDNVVGGRSFDDLLMTCSAAPPTTQPTSTLTSTLG